MDNPLTSPSDNETFIYNLPNSYPCIKHSSLIYIPLGNSFGKCTGFVIFAKDIFVEFFNFELGSIEGYSYEVTLFPDSDNSLPSAKDYCRTAYPDKNKE